MFKVVSSMLLVVHSCGVTWRWFFTLDAAPRSLISRRKGKYSKISLDKLMWLSFQQKFSFRFTDISYWPCRSTFGWEIGWYHDGLYNSNEYEKASANWQLFYDFVQHCHVLSSFCSFAGFKLLCMLFKESEINVFLHFSRLLDYDSRFSSSLLLISREKRLFSLQSWYDWVIFFVQ